MIDLTPLDVRKKRGDFRRLLRGYDPEEVDTFMDLVADRFEELVRENLSLTERTDRMESQLEALEGREKAVQEALVTAQKLREDVKEETRRDAEVVKDQASRSAELLKAEAESEITRRLAEVDAEITRRLAEAESLVRERQFALEELERSRLKFLKSFRALLDREMDAVDVEEARRPLEETPLELEFRGWLPEQSGVEEEVGPAAEAEEVEEAQEEDDSGAVDVGAQPDSPEEVPEAPAAFSFTTAGADATTGDEPVEEADEAEEPEGSSVDEAEPFETGTLGAEPLEAEEEVAEPPVPSFDAAEEEEELDSEPEPVEAGDTSEPGGFLGVPSPESPEEGSPDQETSDVLPSSDEDDPTPSGFETQVFETGTLGSELLDRDEEGGEETASVADDGEVDDTPKEPKWLFSLLKKEEEREGQP